MLEHQQIDSDQSWNLVPLTPEYLEGEHNKYVAAIESALGDKNIRNIALSGNYGVGKSSILREVSRRMNKRVVELSLSTLAPIEATELENSLPKQATTPTNRIQQEIVKQLLYREKTSKTPGSRFRRIERFRWSRGSLVASFLGIITTVIFMLTGWTDKISSALDPYENIGNWKYFITWTIASSCALLVCKLYYGKIRIKQFSAGSATVTLDDNSVSYFDQYLDEIVYFFDVSKCDVVIFEDIDRFNDSHIFETLRALNTLLNTSPQNKKNIRFIYAIKDSIFDHIGTGTRFNRDGIGSATDDTVLIETIRTNRTKFFDLVIPVVPFITHRSARNLASGVLNGIMHNIAPELLDQAVQYVPDMRLLKNARNEFIVFRDRIFSGDGAQLNLSETNLFAMMLYKSTHLTDFETIRLGTSMLDTLYKISRDLVTENIKRVEGERRELLQRIAHIDGVAIHSAKLGERLIAHIQRTIETANFRDQRTTFSLIGSQIYNDDLKKESFWTEFTSPDEERILSVRNNYGETLSFTWSRVAPEFGESLDPEAWDKAVRDELLVQLDEKSADIKFLQSADLGDLIKRSDFQIKYDDKNDSFDEVVKRILKKDLAYHLIRAGYINRNYTLYTSTFHGGRVGPAATNFIIHHIEKDLMDEYFVLSPIDVDAIIRECGKNSLAEPALFNICILDHLLEGRVDLADFMLRSLSTLEENPKRFLQAYATSGKQCPMLIERITKFTPRILIYLISTLEIDNNTRLKFVDIALVNIPSSKLRTDSMVSKYLAEHYRELTSFTSDTINLSQAERIGIYCSESNIKIPDLSKLGRSMIQSLVSRNLYEMTYENLKLAIGNTDSIALDVIRSANEIVYSYVLKHMGSYLHAVDNLSATIESNTHFISVIEDVFKNEISHLDAVIKHAALECNIQDINTAPVEVWALLAEHKRFPATYKNITSYFYITKEIDVHLAKLLSDAGEISECGIVAEDDSNSKIELAIAIVASEVNLPPADLRARLVESLNLREYLNVTALPVENGQLFSLLLQKEIIADDSESYEHLAQTDWSTRESFISLSDNFLNYMTPELIQTDLAMLLESDLVNSSIKQSLIENAEEYITVGGEDGINVLGKFAVQHGYILLEAVVQQMAHEGVESQLIVQLLKPHLSSIRIEQLYIILQSLGGDYPKLTTPGREKPRIPDTPSDRALLERLLKDGVINRYDEDGDLVKVYKRYT